MKSMYRRDFIGTLAAAMAAGLGGMVTQSCTTLRAGYLCGKNGPYDPSQALARLDRNCRAVRRSPALRRAARLYRKRRCNTEVLQDTLETLLVAGMFGDIGENERMDPAVQKRVRSAMPVMSDAFIGMATYMESLSQTERNEIQRMLNEQPEIISEFQVQFDMASRDNGVPQERLDHFHSLFNQCCWRLKNQDPSSIINECVALVDKEGARYGITPEQRRQLATAGGFQQQGRGAESQDDIEDYSRLASLTDSSDTTSANDAPSTIQTIRNEGRRQVGWGAATMGIGAVAEAIGWVGGISSYGSGPFGLFVMFGCVGGAICLITGLVLIITGAVKIHRVKQRIKQLER